MTEVTGTPGLTLVNDKWTDAVNPTAPPTHRVPLLPNGLPLRGRAPLCPGAFVWWLLLSSGPSAQQNFLIYSGNSRCLLLGSLLWAAVAIPHMLTCGLRKHLSHPLWLLPGAGGGGGEEDTPGVTDICRAQNSTERLVTARMTISSHILQGSAFSLFKLPKGRLLLSKMMD